ncbi:hypothetical protein ATK36_4979 [Amycolatopsis sulphurea]|uniref:Uncharacterized protein n=1 Tax=Amycolatopsis sulphurea TaxID=76022 RepID=A0A2A9FH14_9PSEU|nr:hypothetical protein [Amycolatopsis sulphurea]PFG49800.1 hypothetical protein ATK36_4979 [Amycolatopsis sulphurea]
MASTPLTALRDSWSGGRRIERLAYAVGAVLVISGVVNAVVLLVSGGSWLGPLSLRKAVTFGLSFGLTLATLAWVTSRLRMGKGVRTLLLGAFLLASVVEVTLVTMQAWRGVPSHFDFETGFDTAVSLSLAGGGAVLVVTALGFTAIAFRRPGDLAPSMRLAVRAGLVVFMIALATGAVMIARGVTAARSGAPELAYTTAGSLKPLHAVAMHAILVLPALAWLLRFSGLPESRRLRLVQYAVAADSVFTAVIGFEAFAGISPFSAPIVLLILSGASLAILGGTGVVAVISVVRPERESRTCPGPG